jgi:hypothetical protein
MSPVPQQLGYPIHRKAFLVEDFIEDVRNVGPHTTGGNITADFGRVPRGYVWLLDRAMPVAQALVPYTIFSVFLMIQPGEIPLNNDLAAPGQPLLNYDQWIRDYSDLLIVQGTYNPPIIVPEQMRLAVTWDTDTTLFLATVHVEYRIARLHQATVPERTDAAGGAAIVIGG